MQRGVCIRRIRIQTLPDHQHRFAMFVHSFAEKRDVRRQRDVTGNLLPNKLESIVGGPHVLAASGNRVASFRRVIFHGTFMKNRSNVAVTLKNADWCRCRRARLLRPCAIPRGECRHRCES